MRFAFLNFVLLFSAGAFADRLPVFASSFCTDTYRVITREADRPLFEECRVKVVDTDFLGAVNGPTAKCRVLAELRESEELASRLHAQIKRQLRADFRSVRSFYLAEAGVAFGSGALFLFFTPLEWSKRLSRGAIPSLTSSLILLALTSVERAIFTKAHQLPDSTSADLLGSINTVVGDNSYDVIRRSLVIVGKREMASLTRREIL